MANAQISQNVLELLVTSSVTARLSQSVIEIMDSGIPLPSVTCANPPQGAVGSGYNHLFPAAGGVPPYTWAIIAGMLPPGVVLNPVTGFAVGSPTASGIYTFTIQITDSDTPARSAAVNCAIAVVASAGATGGSQQAHPCGKRNPWDWCAFEEMLRLSKITFPPACPIPKEYRNWLPWDEDFGANAIPPGAVPLNKVGGIVTPAPGAGDRVVLSARVPHGYDGLLAGIFHFYTGNGFQQGSGDILWRIRLNQRYLENLGNMAFTLGSPQSPCPLTEGQILLSGQTIQYIVNVPNLSGLIQVGQSQIACGLVGFFWPR